MFRAFRLAFAVSLTALCATTAHAAVTFDWFSTNGDTPTPTGGQLIVTDAAFAAGTWSYHVTRNGTPEANAPFLAASPVLRLFLTGLGPTFNSSDTSNCSDCIYN